MGQDLRALCIGLVYRKVATLSTADFTAGSEGVDVSNLVGSDAQKLPLFTPTATVVWASPVQFIIGMSLLVRVTKLFPNLYFFMMKKIT